MQIIDTDIVVIGSGLAGMTFALIAADQSRRIVVLSRNAHGDSNSRLAQGGVAAALGPGDSSELHLADTLQAGAGLCEAEAAAAVVREAPRAIQFLREVGVEFDCTPEGTLQLGREGAHACDRIVHAGGDATGFAIIERLAARARAHPNIVWLSHASAADLLIHDHACTGVLAWDRGDRAFAVHARAVVLATGGLGQLYRHTTNAPGSVGDGYALAFRAGAVLRDMEFVQFHPTALRAKESPLPLISEAVRGQGALLQNDAQERFLLSVHPLVELAPRDVVAAAIYAEGSNGRSVFLDARPIVDFRTRFPHIYDSLKSRGFDPAHDLIPVVPAAHYTMGGIYTDLEGRTGVQGLFAIGEAASTGLHGANRLASNSLLEGVVTATRAATAACRELGKSVAQPASIPSIAGRAEPDRKLLADVQNLLWSQVGIVRDREGLVTAVARLENWFDRYAAGSTASRNLLTTALLVARAALWRQESRGAHRRADWPEPRTAYHTHSVQEVVYESVGGSPVAATMAH